MKPFVRILAVALIVAAVLNAPLTRAQQPTKEPEQPKLVETMDVRIINVDVVVTDKKGNIVPGLTKDDFEIFENNVPKPITNFYEVAGDRARNAVVDEIAPEPSPSQQPVRKDEVPENMKRRIIIYIDNLSLNPFNRNKVFAQMKEFVKTTMRPGDETMVATFNRSMKVRVPFTRDVTQVNQMLDSILGESAMGVAAKSERKQTEDRIRESDNYETALSAARTYAQSVEHDLRQSVSSINALITTLAGVEGKKIMLLTSEGFPMQPGREAFYYLEEASREKGWQSGATLLEGMSFNSSNLIQSVAKTANANGITMYTIHAAGLTGGSEMSAEHSRPTSFTVAQAAISNSTESMQLIADMTGGLASIQTNNYAAAFDKIKRDLESYYSLGYRAGTERVDRQRYLNVRVKGKQGYIVRNRQTFVEKSVFAEMSDRVVANLLYRVKANDMRVLVRTGAPRPSDDGYYVVPVEVQIPMESLTLLPQGDVEYAGGFDVYVALANKDGDMSDVARKQHQIRVPAADIATVKGKFYTYSMDLLMERGLNRISIGVVDQISNTAGFSREQIIARDTR